MANVLESYLKRLFSDIHATLIGIIIFAVLGLGGIRIFANHLWIQIKNTLQLSTPLWVTALLIFILFLYIYYLKRIFSVPSSVPDPEYIKRFHVLWDKDNNMRCMNCGKLLKCSSSDTDYSRFFCSDRKCDSKHILKDKKGIKITEQEAIKRIEADKKL